MHVTIGGKDVFVVNNFATPKEILELDNLLNQKAFTRTVSGKPNEIIWKHWGYSFTNEELLAMPFVQNVIARASEIFGKKLTLNHGIINVMEYGEVGVFHEDIDPNIEQDGVTAIFYILAPDDIWHPDFGGATIFIDDLKAQENYTVFPSKGKLVLFDSKISHVGLPPNRVYASPRYTLAIKMDAAHE